MASLLLGGRGTASTPAPTGEKYVPGYTAGRERIGQETGAALKTLREQMAYRGLSGGGTERRRLGQIIMAGQGALGDLNEGLAEREADRAFQRTESDKQHAISAAQLGLQAAMGVQDKPNYFGVMGNEHNAAIEQAMQAIRALTGYSMPAMRGGY